MVSKDICYGIIEKEEFDKLIVDWVKKRECEREMYPIDKKKNTSKNLIDILVRCYKWNFIDRGYMLNVIKSIIDQSSSEQEKTYLAEYMVDLLEYR